MKEDFHLHSEFSDDSIEPMEYQIEQAIRLGFKEICFTEHVDYGQKLDWDDPNLEIKPVKFFDKEKSLTIEYSSNVNYPEYFAKIKRMQKAYEGIITIKAGLELGVGHHRIEQYNKLVDKYSDELDFCLLSMHQVNDKALWNREFMEGKTQDEYVLEYYNEILKTAKDFEHYDSVAHLDLITRYDPCGPYPFKKIKDVVAEIFKVIISKNKSLEINTSCWKYKIGKVTPCEDILKLYREMNGEMITIGSDAHNTEYIGDHFLETQKILKEMGFTKYFTYKKHIPIEHNL